ncbi:MULTISPECIES: hypothetical protein [Pseudomonas]|uniref:hypothetical protein n=1 Tax=Pseudomonas TaxID=286 RepID=UPI00114D3D97|nr:MULTISPECIES: hypothetical protein [Pseudomonas]MBH3433677.1 hypothetical protein [Pseudomonas citronellolis]
MEENNGVLALIVAVLVAMTALIQFFLIKRSEEHARQFANYHKLLEDLNEKKDPDGKISGQYLDRQMAIVYELRNLRKYHAITVRVLERCLGSWEKLEDFGYAPVISEAERTIAYIKRNQHKRFRRCVNLDD